MEEHVTWSMDSVYKFLIKLPTYQEFNFRRTALNNSFFQDGGSTKTLKRGSHNHKARPNDLLHHSFDKQRFEMPPILKNDENFNK